MRSLSLRLSAARLLPCRGWPGRVASSPTMAVRRRRKRIARNEDAPPCQTPVGSLRFPLAIALRRDALPRQPVRHLAIIVADLSYRCLDEGGIGESVVVGARPRCERRERACARSGRMLWNPALRFLYIKNCSFSTCC